MQAEVEALGLPFRLLRLEGVRSEEEARQARLEWFATLGGEATALGHQRDDQAETVLKRVFEGSHELGAMRPVSKWGAMTLWRPLLRIPKRELIAWLEERGLSWLEDPTNQNPQYLRSRMRMELIPQLFGKEVADNLCQLAERAVEFTNYLDRQVAEVPFHRGPLGTWVDLAPLDRVERRHIARRLLGSIPRGELEQIVQLKTADRGRLFVFREASWRFEVGERAFERGWEALWRGGVSVPEPEGPYRVEVLKTLPRAVREKRREAGVPQILRSFCPVVLSAEGVLTDPLVQEIESQKKCFINIKIEQKQTN